MTEEALSKTSLMSSHNNIQDILINLVKKYFISEDKINDARHVDKEKEFNIHCGGREDVDVRMIGRPGRPFFLRVTNTDLLPNIEVLNDVFSQHNDKINLVKFINFKYTDKSVKDYMHKCQEKKYKIYNCLIKIDGEILDYENKFDKINLIENMKLYQ